jgi:hypothetical protein
MKTLMRTFPTGWIILAGFGCQRSLADLLREVRIGKATLRTEIAANAPL